MRKRQATVRVQVSTRGKLRDAVGFIYIQKIGGGGSIIISCFSSKLSPVLMPVMLQTKSQIVLL